MLCAALPMSTLNLLGLESFARLGADGAARGRPPAAGPAGYAAGRGARARLPAPGAPSFGGQSSLGQCIYVYVRKFFVYSRVF